MDSFSNVIVCTKMYTCLEAFIPFAITHYMRYVQSKTKQSTNIPKRVCVFFFLLFISIFLFSLTRALFFFLSVRTKALTAPIRRMLWSKKTARVCTCLRAFLKVPARSTLPGFHSMINAAKWNLAHGPTMAFRLV